MAAIQSYCRNPPNVPQNFHSIQSNFACSNSRSTETVVRQYPPVSVDLRSIPRPNRLPFRLPHCLLTAAKSPFSMFQKSFPFPNKEFLSPLPPPQARPPYWHQRSFPTPKIIYCPPHPSLNPEYTSYKELKNICQSDLEFPRMSDDSNCARLRIPDNKDKRIVAEKSRRKSDHKTKYGSGKPLETGTQSSSDASSYYATNEPTRTTRSRSGKSSGTRSTANNYYGYGSQTPNSNTYYKSNNYYNYDSQDQRTSSGSVPTGRNSSNKRGSDKELQTNGIKLEKSKSDEGLDFVFTPESDMATEVTVTIEPEEPDMLEYALDNGIMPIVCGYLPPHISPTAFGPAPRNRSEGTTTGPSSNGNTHGNSRSSGSGTTGSGSGSSDSYNYSGGKNSNDTDEYNYHNYSSYTQARESFELDRAEKDSSEAYSDVDGFA